MNSVDNIIDIDIQLSIDCKEFDCDAHIIIRVANVV